MRGFMILCCLCSLAYGAPGNLNYELQAQNSDYGSYSPSGYDYMAMQNVIGDYGHTGGSSVDAAHGYDAAYGTGYGAHPAPIITKRFFIHSAPQDEEDEHEHRTLMIGTPRKNYNVLFVKAPAGGAKKTTLKISPAVNEDKTVVYVLSQKSKGAEIDAQVYQNTAPTHKPEVFFIKYNTEDEAIHAQQNIQSQYDHLGGSTQISNEGVGTVQSVVGSLGESGAHNAHHTAHTGHSGHGASAHSAASYGSAHVATAAAAIAPATNKYLPPIKK